MFIIFLDKSIKIYSIVDEIQKRSATISKAVSVKKFVEQMLAGACPQSALD